MRKLDPYLTYLVIEAATALFFALAFTYNIVFQTTVARLTPLQLVLVGTALETSIFVFEVPTGIVADLYSRRLSIITGIFLIGLGIILQGSLPIFLPILLAQILWGIGYTFTSGATQAWISDEIGEAAAARAFLRASQVGNLGGLAGIAISTLLAGVRINLPIQVGGLSFLALGLFLIFSMPESGFKPTPQEDRNTWQSMAHTFRSGLGMIQRRPALTNILAIGVFYGLYSEGFDRLWVKLLLDNFNLPTLGPLGPQTWFGIISAVSMLLSIAGVEIATRRLDTGSSKGIARSLMALSALLLAGLLGFSLAGWFIMALALKWWIDVARSVIGPIYTVWVNQRLDPSVRATVLSMSSQMDAIGQIAGGPVLGIIGNLLSVRAALGASGLALSPILLLYRRAIGKGEEPVEAQASQTAQIGESS